MVPVAAAWLKSSGLAIKFEFVAPWGICDLVGLRFNHKKVAHRLKLKQTKAVSSITRAVLLLQIPDADTRKSTSLDKLVRLCTPSIPKKLVSLEMARLIADRFVICSRRGQLQKVNGWMPLQDRLVAVELKLSRIDEAMHQAVNNLGFADESYVGLPADMAHRVKLNISRWSEFFDAGVGLLSVARRGCKILVPARKNHKWTDVAVQLYCVEKFWHTRVTGN